MKKRFPHAIHVKDIKGIHNAHIKAAELSSTTNFWVVDGDSEILESFNFDYELEIYDIDIVHVWRSINPINDLEYGYGGVKLLPKILTLNMDLMTPDMTTSISTRFKPMNEISNITKFNTDPFNTWKSAFRETVKLSSKIINGQDDEETRLRLLTWCQKGLDREFGEYSIKGANAGKEYGSKFANSIQDLLKINDFEWLESQFKL